MRLKHHKVGECMKFKQYFKPKSMIYTGKQVDIKTDVRMYRYKTKEVEQLTDLNRIKEANYIQIIGLNDLKLMQTIQKTFSIDPFIMEDILNIKQRNKVEAGDNYLFSCISFLTQEQNIKKHYMSIYLNDSVVITFHETPPYYLDRLISIIGDYKDLKDHESDLMLYHLFDLITDDHLNILDIYEKDMNAFEENILETKTFDEQAFYLLRKHILQLKNISTPIYEDLKHILNKGHNLIYKESLYYYNDLIDHMSRIEHRLNHLKEIMKTLLDLDMNYQSTKMNKIMSTLTLFSTIFIPLSFLTGFFGMNFIHFNVLKYEYAVLIFVFVCFMIAGTMLYIFKKNKWF